MTEMPEKLLPKQVDFVRCIGKLIAYAVERGYGLTLGEGYVGDSIDKPTEDSPHMRHGNHFNRLALDFNLVREGMVIFDGGDPAWADLGVYWESLDKRAKWGGRFMSRDADHFSFGHNGVA